MKKVARKIKFFENFFRFGAVRQKRYYFPAFYKILKKGLAKRKALRYNNL